MIKEPVVHLYKLGRAPRLGVQGAEWGQGGGRAIRYNLFCSHPHKKNFR
ncbi:hypothetical protein EZS27_024782 [termite gut metagenome]|uniref:Uncharacterized protein n=1 Tax=termite gut metagenome TaxID=433724 RepID=A0A5J4QXS4_9ZZZZ